MSQEGGPRQAFTAGTNKRMTHAGPSLVGGQTMGVKSKDSLNKTGATFYTNETYGNPSYTIKDGGTLKKKVQPMAADKVPRDMAFVPTEQLKAVTAPGSYEISGGIGGKQAKKHFLQKTAAQRLKEMGMYSQLNLENEEDFQEYADAENMNDSSMPFTKENSGYPDSNNMSVKRGSNY